MSVLLGEAFVVWEALVPLSALVQVRVALGREGRRPRAWKRLLLGVVGGSPVRLSAPEQ